MDRAEKLVAQGDIEAARVLLRRAAEAHHARAAFALAATYDPAALGRLGVRGVAGDAALAQQWYDKAREYGSTASTVRDGDRP
jgi:TPR repeat protein